MREDLGIRERLDAVALALAADGPPPDLVERALGTAARRRRARRVATAVAAVAAVTAATVLAPATWHALRQPSVGAGTPSGSGAPTTPALAPEQRWREPAPGGGPRAVQAYVFQRRAFVLNARTARYDELPAVDVALSPDGRTALFVGAGSRPGPAVTVGGRYGFADRDDLAVRGAAAIRWTDLEVTGSPIPAVWSPDSRHVLVPSTTVSVPDGTTRYRLFEPATGTGRDLVLGSTRAFFVPDGSRILAFTMTDQDTLLVPYTLTGERAGAVATTVALPSGEVRYSPDGRRALVGMLVFDTANWRSLAGNGLDAEGWYDDTSLVRVKPDRLEVVDLAGKVLRALPCGPTGRDRRDAAWEEHLRKIQVQSSANLSGDAARYGF